ncbi:hypothetical protein VNO77_03262 [Canavalia gladiata]|uniref:Uncharacterized protein n=1 Tax=Canavalia gladiata TaxID=3824 RepID=A0AAN9MUJ5_CANGL
MCKDHLVSPHSEFADRPQPVTMARLEPKFLMRNLRRQPGRRTLANLALERSLQDSILLLLCQWSSKPEPLGSLLPKLFPRIRSLLLLLHCVRFKESPLTPSISVNFDLPFSSFLSEPEPKSPEISLCSFLYFSKSALFSFRFFSIINY